MGPMLHSPVRVVFASLFSLLVVSCARGSSEPTPRADGGRTCGAGQMLCGDVCADLDVDTRHCGACDTPCDDGERCRAGACEVSCPAGQRACESGGATMCVSTASDPANCGECGRACDVGEVCSSGACASSCAVGLETCMLSGGGVVCADLMSDAAHCGACERPCARGESCAGGRCEVVCPAGQEACGGLCVDLRSDDENCGMCGRTCGPTEGCEASACVTRCAIGQTDCGGICRDLAVDSGHCGMCDRACAGGEICDVGTCRLSCPAGQMACAGSCVFTDRDPLHCGACGNACAAPVGGTAICAMSACTGACPAGRTDCSGTCRDTATDSTHCGACGRACPAGQVCTAATCVPDLPPLGGPTFRIDSLGTTGCGWIDHNALTGDDRGGIGVSTSQVFVTGDNATARMSRTDLSGGVALPLVVDVLVSNLRTGDLYALADAVGPLPQGGGTITRLLRLGSSNAQPSTSGHITLSTPITAMGSTFGATIGIFAGYDRVVIHNGTRVYRIDLPSGVVTDLGAMTIPTRATCENWAYWGIAETDGASTNLVYVQSSTAIVRVRVPTGAVLQTFAFTNLSDMCSITAMPSMSKWFFHHEYSSQFVAASAEHVGSCDATFDTTSPNFRVTAMRTTGCTTFDHALLTGDDRGGIAVSSSHLFYTGDTATVGFPRASLATTPVTVSTQHDGMLTQLRTGTVYVLGSGGRPLLRGGGVATQLIALSATSGAPTTTTVTLSAPIDLGTATFGSELGLYSGYDRVVIHAPAGRVFHVALPSGTVTDLGMMARPTRATCENWAFWGVAEYFGGQLWLASVASSTAISRTRVPDGMTMTVASFTDLSDMCSFVVVPATNRWYFHHEYDSQFTDLTATEVVGYCTAAWSSP